jgi:hypothetical protein
VVVDHVVTEISQASEIKTMERWLRARGVEPPDAEDHRKHHGPGGGLMRLASSGISSLALRLRTSRVITSACAWWWIMPSMKCTSAFVWGGLAELRGLLLGEAGGRLAGGAGLHDVGLAGGFLRGDAQGDELDDVQDAVRDLAHEVLRGKH